MSTKTTFKRIALVAVAALGFGVMSSVAPASAVAAGTATYTVGTASSTPAVTGSTFIISVPVTFTAAATSDTATVSIVTSTKPSASTVTFAADPGQTAVVVASGVTLTPVATSTSKNTITASVNALTTATSAVTATSKFAVSVNLAGTYVFAIIDDLDASGTLTTGDTSTYFTVTVVDSAASSISLATEFSATYASYVSGAAGANGAWVKISVKDAAGAPTVLNSSQMVLVTVPSTLSLRNKAVSGSSTAVGPVSAGSYGLVAADFDKNGIAYVNVTGSTGTSTMTANITGGTANAASLALTYKAVTGNAATAGALTNLATATVGAGAAVAAGSAVNITAATTGTVSKTATSLAVTIVAAAAQVTGVKVANGSVGSTLYGGGTLAEDVIADSSLQVAADLVAAASTGGAAGQYAVGLTITKTLALQANGAGATIVISPYTTYTSATALQAFTITGKTTAVAALTLVAPTAATIVAAPGTSTTVNVKCVDEFGSVKSNVSLTPVLSGRNSALVVLPSLVTSATGYATFTYADLSTSTTSLIDTIAVNNCGTTGTILTVNYSSDATFGVSAVKWTAGGAYGDATSYAGKNTTAISGADNPSAAPTSLTFTVKDVNAVAIVGAPYTVALTGSTSAALVKSATSDQATGFTTSTGITVKLFAWAPGTSTVTVTVGGKTVVGTVTWANSASAADARVLSVTSAGGVVSIKVVDRFGNGVGSVGVALTRTGTGFFAGGASTATATTDENGTVDMSFTGTGSVKATLPATSTQAIDIAGEINAVAVTAPVAGTTTGTGSTFAPAGVRTVTVTVDGIDAATAASTAAADAAAEATDAANAATDAANAAAEAADAATAAAQDAADAVAALSTQVTEMVNALKKQITALTNLVIKIQKKVKA